MPVFFQQQINDTTRLGIWKIEESEEFFKNTVPQHREVTHPHKRLQHLAGRFLLQFLFPGFPYELIEIADTRKPYLPDEQYHFSISHCGDYAAAIVSSTSRVGIDIEIPVEKIERIAGKFLSIEEMNEFRVAGYKLQDKDKLQPATWNLQPPLRTSNLVLLTSLWSAKEAVFKWYGNGGVDFSEQIQLSHPDAAGKTISCRFTKNNTQLTVHYHHFDHLVLCWVGK